MVLLNPKAHVSIYPGPNNSTAVIFSNEKAIYFYHVDGSIDRWELSDQPREYMFVPITNKQLILFYSLTIIYDIDRNECSMLHYVAYPVRKSKKYYLIGKTFVYWNNGEIVRIPGK